MGRIGRSNARVEITSSASKFDVGLRDARKKLAGFGGYARKALGAVGGLAGKIGSGLSMGLGVNLFDGIGSVVGDVMETEKALTRLQIAGSRTPAQMDALRASLSDVASTTGIARQELIAGASAYVALTGDADGASQAVGLFAKVANATGASMDDIAATAASMRDNLKIDPKDFEAAFSALHVQGKMGAVEMREIAQEAAGLAPSFSKFAGGQGPAGLAEMGAALQVTRKDFGSTSEAASGLRQLFASLTRGSGKLKKLGIEVFNKDGSKRNFTEIIDEVVAAGLTEPQLQKILGSDEALRAIGALKTHRALLGDIRAASSDVGAIERDAATFRESTAGKLQIAMETLKASVADAFTPERIQAFVGAIGSAVQGISTVITKLGEAKDALGDAGRSIGDAAWRMNHTAAENAEADRVADMEYQADKQAKAKAIQLKSRVDEAAKAGFAGNGAWRAYQEDKQAKAAGPLGLVELQQRKAAAANPAAAPPVNVYINGNQALFAVGNATDARRKPGG